MPPSPRVSKYRFAGMGKFAASLKMMSRTKIVSVFMVRVCCAIPYLLVLILPPKNFVVL